MINRSTLMSLQHQIESAIGQYPNEIRQLYGGSIGQVYAAVLPDGRQVVIKLAMHRGQPHTDSLQSSGLALEARMLRYLDKCSPLTVPQVLFSTDDLLIMTFIEGESDFDYAGQTHAAEIIARLHDVTDSQYGFDYDTVIGSLHQPNPRSERWIPFFRDHRLLYMAKAALKEGSLPLEFYRRLETLAARLEDWLIEPERPSLLHGDLWTTNLLARDGKITGFLDPAVYFGHPEIELAFTTLFNTFGSAFFERYRQLRPIEPGFFEQRRDLYNLYPLLVHVRLFGAGYLPPIAMTLRRFQV